MFVYSRSTRVCMQSNHREVEGSSHKHMPKEYLTVMVVCR